MGPGTPANWVTLNNDALLITSFDHLEPAVFTPNVDYYYRVRAQNTLGWGPYSTELKVTTDNVP